MVSEDRVIGSTPAPRSEGQLYGARETEPVYIVASAYLKSLRQGLKPTLSLSYLWYQNSDDRQF